MIDTSGILSNLTNLENLPNLLNIISQNGYDLNYIILQNY